jgi:hypothetical protein
VRHATDPPDVAGRSLAQASRLRTPAAVAALLSAFSLLAFLSLRGDSATSDELPHLPAGISYVDRLDFRLNPEHPPLAKAWAALPLKIAGLPRADYASTAWRRGDQWNFGQQVLYGAGNPLRLLVPARSAVVLLGCLLGLVLFLFARDLFGRTAAFAALGLFAFSPTMLAHARLVTTDVPAALGFLLSVWTFRRFCRRPAASTAVAAGAALGVALLLKFSTVLLIPILAFLAVLWVLEAEPAARRVRLRQAAAGAAAVAATAWLCLWAGYGFRFAAPASGGPFFPPPSGGLLKLAWTLRLVPEAYVHGLSFVSHGLVREAYLNGEIGSGWWYYFPEAFLLKSTPSLLLLLGWGAFRAVQEKRRTSSPWTLDDWILVLPPVAYFAAAMASGMNIGHRHLAPLYPFLFMAAGRAAAGLLEAGPRARLVGLLLLAGQAGSALAAHPGHLSYFNALAGGTRGGHRYLLDSNLDWGQDLVRLGRRMKDLGLEELHLIACFENGDPRAYGVRYRHRLDGAVTRPLPPEAFPRPGQAFAVSLNVLHGLYQDAPAVQDFMATVRTLTPLARAGDSILIYRMPEAARTP